MQIVSSYDPVEELELGTCGNAVETLKSAVDGVVFWAARIAPPTLMKGKLVHWITASMHLGAALDHTSCTP